MKDQRKTEIKVGVTVIVGLIIFIWIFTWSKNLSLTSNEKTLKVKFDNVSGLEIGDYVTVNGVRKGNVEDLFVSGKDVIVKMIINDDVHLKEDATFSITMLDLMGGKKIEVFPGISEKPLNFNEIQEGKFYADIPEVMGMIGTARDDLFVILEDVKLTLNSINKYLQDEEINNNIRTSLKNLSEVSERLNLMINENRENLNQLILNSKELSQEAKDFIKQNKEELSASIESLQQVLLKADTLVENSNKIISDINSQESNIGKILYDKEIYENLVHTLKQVRELTDILVEQLKNDGINVDANVDLF